MQVEYLALLFFFLFPRCGQSYLGRYCSLSEYALELCIPQWEREKTQGKAQMGATSPAEVAQQHSAVTADTRGPVGSRFTQCCKVHAAQRACFRHCQAHFTAPAAPAGRAGRSVQHRGRFGVMQTPLTTGTRSCQPGAATSAAVQPARNLPLVGMSLNNCPGENITLLTKISQLAILALAGPQSQ